MNYEKKYKEALEKAKKCLKDGTITNTAISYIGTIFPELKESEDERMMNQLHSWMKEFGGAEEYTEKVYLWLKGLLEKQGEQKPQGKTALEAINEEKVDNANKVEPRQDELTKFEKAVKQVMEEAIECGDTHNLKADADMLLNLLQKSAWSEEDKKMFLDIESLIHSYRTGSYEYELSSWFNSLKDRVQPQPKQEWSKDSKRKMYRIYSILGQAADAHAFSTTCRLIGDKECIELQDFLKSLTPQSTWKPSKEQMMWFGDILDYHQFSTEGQKIMQSLYNDLKKLRGE